MAMRHTGRSRPQPLQQTPVIGPRPAFCGARRGARGGNPRARPAFSRRDPREGTPTVPEEISLYQELVTLDERRRRLEGQIADALNRQLYSADAGTAEAARSEERRLLGELDRLLTRARAVEGQLLQIRRRRPQ
jgi:hypothetical protein